MLKGAILGLALTLSGPAKASEWWLLSTDGTSPKVIAFFGDRESLRDSHEGKRVWVTALFQDRDMTFKRMTNLYVVDCANSRYRTAASNFEKRNGEMFTPELSPNWTEVPPDSTAEIITDFACNNKVASGATGPITVSPEEAASALFHLFSLEK